MTASQPWVTTHAWPNGVPLGPDGGWLGSNGCGGGLFLNHSFPVFGSCQKHCWMPAAAIVAIRPCVMPHACSKVIEALAPAAGEVTIALIAIAPAPRASVAAAAIRRRGVVLVMVFS